MSTLNDVRFQVLRQTLTGATNEMLLQYWNDLVAPGTAVTVNEAKMEFLIDQGFTEGTLNDRWFALLRVSFTGAISDMELQYWESKVI